RRGWRYARCEEQAGQCLLEGRPASRDSLLQRLSVWSVRARHFLSAASPQLPSYRFRDFDTECDAGQCCSIPDQQTLYWETCENGGYFISSNCQQDSDCVGNTRANSRWVNENQICLHYECCTVPVPGDPTDLDPNYGNFDNRDPNWNYQCANGGYY